MENNSQIKLQEIAVDTAKNDQRIADKTAELLEDYYFKRGMMSADNPELGPKQAKIALDLANASLDYTKRSINLGVETAYYGVLQAQKNEEVM